MPFSMPSRVPPMPSQRPMPKTPEKPPQPLKPFGGGFRSWDEMKGSARRFPWEKSTLPGTGTKIGESERAGIVERMRQLLPSQGGLSEQSYRDYIVPQLKRKMSQLESAGKIDEKIKLQREMQLFEEMTKK